jgi:hypothetical protein
LVARRVEPVHWLRIGRREFAFRVYGWPLRYFTVAATAIGPRNGSSTS